MRSKPWIDKEGEGGPTRADEIFKDAVDGLREYYPCLISQVIVARLRKLVNCCDTGNNQLDYENMRDQVEKLAKGAEAAEEQFKIMQHLFADVAALSR